jgi:hypothetical protein
MNRKLSKSRFGRVDKSRFANYGSDGTKILEYRELGAALEKS